MSVTSERIIAMVQWVVIFAIAALGVVYAGDYLRVRGGMAAGPQSGSATFGSVMVQRYWEIPQKNGKTEYSFDPPTQQACIHSIFPHGGYSPCWYLSRNKLVRMSWMGGQNHESVQAAERIAARFAEAGRVPKV